jgi:hypothetical protein
LRSPVENIRERMINLTAEEVEEALVREWGAGPPTLLQPTEHHYPGQQQLPHNLHTHNTKVSKQKL